MSVIAHARAAVSLVSIVLNLLAWSFLLAFLLLLRATIPSFRSRSRELSAHIYRMAVAIDDWCLQTISRVPRNLPNLNLAPSRTCIVVANHRSWSDIFVLQSMISRHGPIIKFLCKQELAYIPLFGLIILAFDFPVVRRKTKLGRSDEARRADDRRRVREACKGLYESPAAMLSFVEGTRFSRDRHRELASPYRLLLPPRSSGFTEIVAALEDLDPVVVDATLIYSRDVTFWEFLGGTDIEVTVCTDQFCVQEVIETDPTVWLKSRWSQKDAMLARIKDEQAL